MDVETITLTEAAFVTVHAAATLSIAGSSQEVIVFACKTPEGGDTTQLGPVANYRILASPTRQPVSAAAGELLQPGTYQVGVCSAAFGAATTQTYVISGDVQAVITQ